MTGWVGDIEAVAEDNANFRTVVYTGVHTQLTAPLALLPA